MRGWNSMGRLRSAELGLLSEFSGSTDFTLRFGKGISKKGIGAAQSLTEPEWLLDCVWPRVKTLADCNSHQRRSGNKVDAGSSL
jgi:hypothetical protein